MHTNTLFWTVLLQSVAPDSESLGRIPPLPFTIVSLSSYLVTHASATFSPRSIAYANLSLNVLLTFVENDEFVDSLCQPRNNTIPLCRQVDSLVNMVTIPIDNSCQRVPALPAPRPCRSPLCAILDCCVLWLRHNLHMQLEVFSYS